MQGSWWDKQSRSKNEQDSVVENGNIDTTQEVNPKKETDKKMSPLSTLESSFEALNVKKFDVAFAVDPVYHQTSAQFDEGGAKGLLLNNLGVYADVVFSLIHSKCQGRKFLLQISMIYLKQLIYLLLENTLSVWC